MWTIETRFFTQGNSAPATVGANKGKVFATSDWATKKMDLLLTEGKAQELAARWNKENEGVPNGPSYTAVPIAA